MFIFRLLISQEIFEILFKKRSILRSFDQFFLVSLFVRVPWIGFLLRNGFSDVPCYFCLLPLVGLKVDRTHHFANRHLFPLTLFLLPLEVFPHG